MAAPTRRRLLLLGRRGARYLLHDQFVTAAVAPVASPRVATPGPGTLAITDTGNRLSIANGALQFAAGGAAGDPSAWGEALDRRMGRTVLARVSKATTNTFAAVGWDTAQAGTINGAGVGFATNGNIVPYDAGTVLASAAAPYLADTLYDVATVLRPSGAYILHKLASEYLWTLNWVGANGTTDPIYPAIINGAGAAAVSAVRVADLGGAFGVDHAIALTRLAGVRAVDDAFTHPAAFMLDATITRPSASSVRITFRVVDASNRMQMTVSSAGTITVSEVLAGATTALITSAAGALAAATPTRVVLIVDGVNLYLFYGTTVSGTTAAATNFGAATSGAVPIIGTDGVVADLIVWPRTVALPSGI